LQESRTIQNCFAHESEFPILYDILRPACISLVCYLLSQVL